MRIIVFIWKCATYQCKFNTSKLFSFESSHKWIGLDWSIIIPNITILASNYLNDIVSFIVIITRCDTQHVANKSTSVHVNIAQRALYNLRTTNVFFFLFLALPSSLLFLYYLSVFFKQTARIIIAPSKHMNESVRWLPMNKPSHWKRLGAAPTVSLTLLSVKTSCIRVVCFIIIYRVIWFVCRSRFNLHRSTFFPNRVAISGYKTPINIVCKQLIYSFSIVSLSCFARIVF